MPDYRRRNLDEPQSSPPLEPLRGRQLMRRSRASAIHATGDRVLSHGRRILACVGLHGAKAWHFPDSPGAGPTKVYPTLDSVRIAAQTPALALTPGHFVRATVIANPSGRTESATIPAGSSYQVTGAGGQVRIVAVYTKGANSVIQKIIPIPPSGLANAGQPTGAGGAWSQIYRYRTGRLLPADLDVPANLAAWTDGVVVTLAVSYVGSPRAIDVVIHEEPYALAYEYGTDEWIAPMHAGQNGGNLGQLIGPGPVIRQSASDPGGGAEIVTDAARRLSQELGPVLLSVSAWDEANQDVTASEPDYRTISGAAYKELFSGSTTAYATTAAGSSLSSGANARRVQDSEATAVLRDRDNVVPVRCYIYGSMSTTVGIPTATVRFESSAYSIAEVQVPSGTADAWHSAPGHLRCGLGAQNPIALQVRGRVWGSGDFRWRHIVVVYDDL
jgi:hypothetical protein